jgi:hypothetical protein
MSKKKRPIAVPKKRKKKYQVTPTARQKEAFKRIMVEKGRKKGEILKSVGFSDAVAKAPSKVTKARGFLQLLKEYVPEDLVFRRHGDLLNAKKRVTIRHYGDDMEEVTEEIDRVAVKAGVDMGHKLWGHFAKDNEQKAPDVVVNVALREQINKALDDL